MRTLILGSTRQCLVHVCKELMIKDMSKEALEKKENKKDNTTFEIFTSYQASGLSWAQVPLNPLPKITQYQEWKEEKLEREPPSSVGLVIEIIAKTFFQTPWVKERLAKEQNLYFLTTDPATFLDPMLYTSFHRIYMTKTNTPAKTSQYHTLFLKPQTVTFTTFQKVVRDLKEHEALLVTPQGGYEMQVFNTFNTLTPVAPVTPVTPVTSVTPFTSITSSTPLSSTMPKIDVPKTISNPTMVVMPKMPKSTPSHNNSTYSIAHNVKPSFTEVTHLLEDQKSQSSNGISSNGICSNDSKTCSHGISSHDITALPAFTSLACKRPEHEPPVGEDLVEFWVHLKITSRKKPSSLLSDALDITLSHFHDCLNNDLLKSMFTKPHCERICADTSSVGYLCFYFQVYKQRQDLFVALLMNILQSLRASHFITQGALLLA